MNISKAVGLNKLQVQHFSTAYQNLLTSDQYNPHKISNKVETEVSKVQNSSKIVVGKGAMEAGRMTGGERGKSVTVLCASNAA